MARREGPSGEEPRLGRAPVLSSCEFEDLGRRLIVIDGVAELLEVDAHLYLFLRLPSRAADSACRWSDGVSARLHTWRSSGSFRRASTMYSAAATAAACAFFAHRGVCSGGSGSSDVVFDADRKLQSEGIVPQFLACHCAVEA